MDFLREALGHNKIDIVDVGAAHSENCYQSLLINYPCNCIALDAEGGDGIKQDIIGDGSQETFYHCEPEKTSSCYKPNLDWINEFQSLTSIIKSEEKVKTKRIDSLGIDNIDFLRMDAQGSEFNIITGTGHLMSNIIVIGTEICFVPLYEKQPLFAEIDIKLRSLGFLFHRFQTPVLLLSGRTLKPIIFNNNKYIPISQVMWSDVVYLRPVYLFNTLSPLKLLKMAIILDEVYNSYDFSYRALAWHESKTHAGLLQKYEDYLKGKKFNTTLSSMKMP